MDRIKKFLLLKSDYFIPGWLILFKDLLLVLFALAAAYTLRYNFQLPDHLLQGMYSNMVSLTAITLVVHYACGLNKSIIRHTSLNDVILIFKANFIVTCLLILLNILEFYFHIPVFRIPHSVIIIFFILSTVIVILTRFAVRLFYYWLKSGGEVTRVLIYGAGSAGIITKNVLHADLSCITRVAGFVDNNPGKIGKTIEGIYVYSTGVLNPKFLKDHGIKQIIMAIHNIDQEKRRDLVEEVLRLTNLQVKEVPPVDNWINGQLSLKQINPVKISELLQRSEIKLRNEHVSRQIEGKRILVTGAAGSIGSELVRQLFRFRPAKLIVIDQGETPMFHLENGLKDYSAASPSPEMKAVMEGMEFIIANIGDPVTMEQIFAEQRPHVVFHAAAYKHVPMMERNPFEAVRVNIFGTKTLADLAAKYHCEKFVMISTDKAVNPTNVMGATKRAAEIYIQSLNKLLHSMNAESGLLPVTEFITTRFGNVLGSNGSVIPVFEKQIKAGGPVTVTHPDITRYFMTIPEACQLVLEAGALGNGGEILMFDMGKPVKIAELARNMIRLSGLVPEKDIKIVYTGLRPGEKLYEELLYDRETGQKTHHPKIFIAQTSTYPFEDVMNYLSVIQEIAKDRLDSMNLVARIKDLIPEFLSNNSIYEELDRRA
ncbi:MAG TPA: nucleoside-diphosphate sugar epimerase/dehydratase [Lentimicrobium sp.]|nr:nucleoside-diphosphate sugar epimerase/dehydratase [Bacteroidales bacterium]HLO92303.1 nucleoside-diphosphate sugar epimerase/dehydratase [Lentimicrobium sp.]